MMAGPKDSAFLGVGWTFPPSFNVYSQSVDTVAGVDAVQQSINLILSICPGERQMLPEFGCDLRQFVFTPVDTSVETMIQSVVKQALLDYEPRINVDEVSVAAVGDDGDRRIEVTVVYTVRSTNQRFNLVYPYYLNEATGIPQ